MDDIAAVEDRVRPPTPTPAPRLRLRVSTERHHRRRRLIALALLGLATLALSGGMVVGAGAGTGHAVSSRAATGPGFFARVQMLAGGGPASFAAAERTAENEAINRTLAYTPYVRIAGAQHRELALTFDDGPGPYTPQVLAALAKAGVPATFFEVGVMDRYFNASTTAIAARGYALGDHTEGHVPMGKLSPNDQKAQLLGQIAVTRDYGAPYPRMFRPPFGSWDAATLKLLHKYRMLMVLWTVDTSDYRRPGVRAIVHSALSGARPGAIILMHDAGGDRSETVAALPRIIRGLRARGYTLVTVPRLLLDNPAPHDQDISAVIGIGG